MNCAARQLSNGSQSLWRSGLVLILALLAIVLGQHIPVPGFNTAALAQQSLVYNNQWSARYSIFSLGMMPIVAVLVYVEIAKLLMPWLAKESVSPFTGTAWISWLSKTLILLISATQGYAVWMALLSMGLVPSTTAAMVGAILSFMAATAVLIWLASIIRFPGLNNGLWWLLAMFSLTELPNALRRLLALFHSEMMWLGVWVFCGVVLILAALALMAVLMVARKVLAISSRTDISTELLMSALMWPPLLASIVGGHVLGLCFWLSPHAIAGRPWLIDAITLVATIVLVPLFGRRYLAQVAAKQGMETKGSAGIALWWLVGLQVQICAGFWLLDLMFAAPILPTGATFIVFVCVVLALCRGLSVNRAKA